MPAALLLVNTVTVPPAGVVTLFNNPFRAFWIVVASVAAVPL